MSRSRRSSPNRNPSPSRWSRRRRRSPNLWLSRTEPEPEPSRVAAAPEPVVEAPVAGPSRPLRSPSPVRARAAPQLPRSRDACRRSGRNRRGARGAGRDGATRRSRLRPSPSRAAPAEVAAAPESPRRARPVEVAAVEEPATTSGCDLDNLYNVLGFNENSNDLTPRVTERLDQIIKDIGDNVCTLVAHRLFVHPGRLRHQRAVRGRARAERAALPARQRPQLHAANAVGAGETDQFGPAFSDNRRVVITVTP